MAVWKPMTLSEFEVLYGEQRSSLSAEAKQVFERFRVPTRVATIRRSSAAGDELVFVVAESPRGVVYFDDVEYGFNISPLAEDERIISPGGSQMSLADAIVSWLIPQCNKGT